MNLRFGEFIPYIPFILQGIPVIILLSLSAAAIGCVLGLICAFAKRKGGIGGGIAAAYIDFFRGTPVYVQLCFFHLALPQLLNFNWPGWVSCILIFSLNSGAYLAEVMRAGIDGIDKGQIEAAKALGVKNKDITKDIIIPQALRNVLPAMFNEFIALTKETSVVSVVGMMDLMRRATIVQGSVYMFFEPLTLVLISYYLLNKVLSFIGSRLERKLKYD